MLKGVLELMNIINLHLEELARRESQPKETGVDPPYFYGKENVETYLDWENESRTTFCLPSC